MDTHSVQSHLRVAASDYDAAIRTFVPHYDELLQTGVSLLQQLSPAAPEILDLGGGTGGLSQAILSAIPGSRVTLLDIDLTMLDQARTRLAPFAGRVTFLQASFSGALPASDATAASLSLHHLHDLDAKTAVYASIRKALRPGGLFLNLDATVNSQERISRLTFRAWAEAMAQHGITGAQAREHFAAWEKEDRYFSLAEELQALQRAGFTHPECFWRRSPVSIYGGLA